MVPLHPVPTDVPARMLDAMAPRGPDDRGWVLFTADGPEQGKEVPPGSWNHPFLLHRRLSILDLSDAAHQPMPSHDGRYQIVYNGEVYNFKELRQELQALGHSFASDGDTEVVLAAYQEWGPAAVERFVGMFALAIVDTVRHRLFLARDHFGIKPLFYAHGSWGFAFASDLPTLLQNPEVSRIADPARVHRYLTTGSGINSYGAATMFRDVNQVPAAHWLEVDLLDGRPDEPVRYWDLDVTTSRAVSYEEAVAEVRKRFLESVRIHLRSDVAVGAALSGGIDSSSIVAAMRHHSGPERPIHTFSYLADDPKVSEEHWIRIMESAAGATGHGIYPNPSALQEDLPRLIAAQGEPFGSTSIYAQYCVFRAARSNGIKVMLDGQGADEMLAGYRGYYPDRLATLLRKGRLLRALRLFQAMRRETGVRARPLAIETLVRATPERLMARARHTFGKGGQGSERWLHAPWFSERGVSIAPPPPKPGKDRLRVALYESLTENSLPHLLRYEDRNSMAHSVESRVPFLDHRLVAYILSLPEEFILGEDATTKRVFRDAMRGLVPDEILDRRDKMGFQTTEKDWMISLDHWVESTLGSEAAARIPFLRLDAMRAEWQDIKEGRRPYTWTVWRWMNLIEWTRLMDVHYDEAPLRAPMPIPAPLAVSMQGPEGLHSGSGSSSVGAEGA